PMIHVGHRTNILVDPLVDAHEVAPCRLRHHDVARRTRRAATVAWILAAELDPADRRPGLRPDAGKEAAFDACPFTGILLTRRLRCSRQSDQDGERNTCAPSTLPHHCGPPLFLLGHTSHKGFAPMLSRRSRFEADLSIVFRVFDEYLNRIQLKFERI